MKRTSHGMTLIEIIFALAIVGTLLTLSYAAALGAWRNATAANQRTQAQYMIQQTMEALKAYRESDDFDWGAFRDEVNLAGALMYIGLQQADGSITTNNFSCQPAPIPPATCKFELQSGVATITPVGSNVNVASSTPFTVEIKPIRYFTENTLDGTEITAPPSLPNNTTAITFLVTARWDDANGIASNAAASTIITEPR
ncbi:prepilin-type N-terminal cleavage/methylation domain-containing protein [bacterium]|nr:MAG: prepilin-type N-terminal cleavage/methylation domain-containing protein [bacterium]